MLDALTMVVGVPGPESISITSRAGGKDSLVNKGDPNVKDDSSVNIRIGDSILNRDNSAEL